MLILGPHFGKHRRWAGAFAGGTGAAVAAFAATAWLQEGVPGGGSLLGLVFGGLAAVIFLFEFALAWREWSRRREWSLWRGRFRCPAGSVQGWMRAHIWLGLFCVPLVLLHAGGPRLPRGELAVAAEAVFFVVIGSGLLLLYRQNRLPRRLTAEVAGETIARQIDEVMRTHTEELAREIDDVCGGPAGVELAAAAVGYRPATTAAGRTRRRANPPRPPAAEVPGAEPVRRFFLDHACAYLLTGRAGRSSLGDPADAAGFERLRGEVPPTAHRLLAELERLCARRRELDRQGELDNRLRCWRLAHVPLSALLIGLTVAHALTALRYW